MNLTTLSLSRFRSELDEHDDNKNRLDYCLYTREEKQVGDDFFIIEKQKYAEIGWSVN